MRMGFIREKTIKGRRYRYYQHNVRKGKKVVSVMTYLGAVGAMTAISVLAARDAAGKDKPIRYKSRMFGTDKRANAHQEAYNRERWEKEMADPAGRFAREAGKAKMHSDRKAGETPKPSRADVKAEKAKAEEMREFNERLKEARAEQEEGIAMRNEREEKSA